MYTSPHRYNVHQPLHEHTERVAITSQSAPIPPACVHWLPTSAESTTNVVTHNALLPLGRRADLTLTGVRVHAVCAALLAEAVCVGDFADGEPNGRPESTDHLHLRYADACPDACLHCFALSVALRVATSVALTQLVSPPALTVSAMMIVGLSD